MLYTIPKEAYLKSIKMSPINFARDSELHKELKKAFPIDDGSHIVIIMSKSTYEGFKYGSQYYHNAQRFHQALFEESTFELIHADSWLKEEMSDQALSQYRLIEMTEELEQQWLQEIVSLNK